MTADLVWKPLTDGRLVADTGGHGRYLIVADQHGVILKFNGMPIARPESVAAAKLCAEEALAARRNSGDQWQLPFNQQHEESR
jgi:hypothetical protein